MFSLFVFLTIPIILLEALENDGVFKKYPIDGRIIGGQDADIKDYPYMLSLAANGTHACGAGLIADKWAVTAAHCVFDLIAADFSIRANSSFIDTGEDIPVVKIIQHPNFSYRTGDSDIALLELSAAVSCKNCKPISLGTTTPPTRVNVTITGWGITTADYDYYTDESYVLQVAQVPVVAHDVCKEAYAAKLEFVSENMFCAGYFETGGVDSCLGDSGGPVVIDGVLVGLVSWGRGCAQPGFPGVYTLVPNFKDWIRNNTGGAIE